MTLTFQSCRFQAAKTEILTFPVYYPRRSFLKEEKEREKERWMKNGYERVDLLSWPDKSLLTSHWRASFFFSFFFCFVPSVRLVVLARRWDYGSVNLDERFARVPREEALFFFKAREYTKKRVNDMSKLRVIVSWTKKKREKGKRTSSRYDTRLIIVKLPINDIVIVSRTLRLMRFPSSFSPIDDRVYGQRDSL